MGALDAVSCRFPRCTCGIRPCNDRRENIDRTVSRILASVAAGGHVPDPDRTCAELGLPRRTKSVTEPYNRDFPGRCRRRALRIRTIDQ